MYLCKLIVKYKVCICVYKTELVGIYLSIYVTMLMWSVPMFAGNVLSCTCLRVNVDVQMYVVLYCIFFTSTQR